MLVATSLNRLVFFGIVLCVFSQPIHYRPYIDYYSVIDKTSGPGYTIVYLESYSEHVQAGTINRKYGSEFENGVEKPTEPEPPKKSGIETPPEIENSNATPPVLPKKPSNRTIGLPHRNKTTKLSQVFCALTNLTTENNRYRRSIIEKWQSISVEKKRMEHFRMRSGGNFSRVGQGVVGEKLTIAAGIAEN